MTNTTGPDELYNLIGGLDVDGTTLVYLASCAAAWEADLSARDHAVDLAGINAEAANELERRAERAEAALERARALVGELEWCGVDNWLECPWCLGTKAEHYGEPAGHKPDCKLAAFLAAASGGAA